MEFRSELVELEILNNEGTTSTYYTYDGYYDESDRSRVRAFRKKVEKGTFTSAVIIALLSFCVRRG
jgi:peptidoglycan hydrolase-like protein with peptidoglycan-binding domain